MCPLTEHTRREASLRREHGNPIESARTPTNDILLRSSRVNRLRRAVYGEVLAQTAAPRSGKQSIQGVGDLRRAVSLWYKLCTLKPLHFAIVLQSSTVQITTLKHGKAIWQDSKQKV